jgi:hypothetical protein
MSATTYARDKIIDDLTGVAAYSPPVLWLSLHTADPGVAGSHANEVAGGGYARKSLAGLMGAADSSGVSVNTSVITIGPATSDWGTVTHLAIEDAIATGNMLVSGMPVTPRTITSGQPFQIPPGKLQLRLA